MDALGDIQQLSTVTCIIGIVDHINTEANCLICSQFYIYLCDIIVDHLIQYVEQLLWHYHRVVQTTWNLEGALGCYIIFASYGSTYGDGGPTFCLGGEVELRQGTCVLEQRFWQLIPCGTTCMSIALTGLNRSSFVTWSVVKYQCTL